MTIKSVVATLKEQPLGDKLRAAGDLNVKLSEPEGYQRGKEISAALTMTGLEDMLEHFLLRQIPWCRDGRMWSMV